MRFFRRHGSVLLVALSSLDVACSADKDGSEVTPGEGTGGTTAATGGTTGSAGTLLLGGGNDGSGASAGDTGLADLPSEVNVIITADNAYGFGYGTGARLANYFGGIENTQAADIFSCPVGRGPEAYVVPPEDANAGGYLYIVGYADKSTTQGVIAKFFREGAAPIYTGTGKWEVCATGKDYDPGSGGPTQQTIDEYIGRCNAGDLDPSLSSGGWVTTADSEHGKLVFGEDNSTERDLPAPGNEFPKVCDIEDSARWMWFDWEAERVSGSPFLWPDATTNVTRDFLIFRLGAEEVPRKPPT
jgi:hypothetical protein